MSTLLRFRGLALLVALVLAAACDTNTSTGAAVSPQTSDPAGTVPASGDIPDNVVWLNYSGSGFSIQYAEGWVRSTTPNGVAFSDKDSRITVAVNSGPAPTNQSATRAVAGMVGAQITTAAHQLSLPAGTAIKLTYTVDGSPDPVTGKRPHLTVERYEIGASGRAAVLELAAQVGVDNVDAYLAIAKSFKWTA